MIISEIAPANASNPVVSVLQLIRRRKAVLLIPMAAGVAVGFIGYSTAPWSFVSEAVLVLDVRRVQAFPTESVISPLPQENPVLRTEIDVITSRMMAQRVIQRLQTEGITAHEADPTRSYVSDWRNQVAALFSGAAYAQRTIPSPVVGDVMPGAERRQTDLLISNLRVSNDERSYTIFISYRAPDPVYAATVANAYAQAYLDHQIGVQQTATRRVSDWLGEKLVTLRADVEASEKMAEDFRQKSGLAQNNGVTFQAQRVAALNTELVTATGAVTLAEARFRTASLLQKDSEMPAMPEILSSASIQSLRSELAKVERQINELKTNGALKSIELPVLISDHGALKTQIAGEVNEIIKSLSNEIEIAERRRTTVDTSLRVAEHELDLANQAEVKAAQIEREAKANRTIYESYLQRYKQTIEQDGIAAPEAQMISMAEPATARVSPRLPLWLLFGLSLGATAAIFFTALLETLEKAFRSTKSLETATDIPVIAKLPFWSSDAKDTATSAKVLSRMLDQVHAAIKVHKSKIIAIVSTSEGEGKTVLVCGLARQLAASGTRVAIVDTNFSAPSIAQKFGLRPTDFIDDLTEINKSAADIIQRDPVSGVSIIAARGTDLRSRGLLTSPNFQRLLKDLEASHDVVLVDTNAISSSSDALFTAAAADTALLVVDPAKTDTNAVLSSIQNLSACGRTPKGIVVNQTSAQSKAGTWRDMLSARQLFGRLTSGLPWRSRSGASASH